ncbi:MAG: c-type cytochrome [Pseudomonadota bacterium]
MAKVFIKVIGSIVVIAVVAAGSLLLWAGNQVEAKLAEPQTYAQLTATELEGAPPADIELGKHIVNSRNGCVECHGSDLAGKTFINDPAIGVLSGTNLTPSAMGSKSDVEIIQSLRFGVKGDLKPLVFMPSHEFQHLSLHDMQSIVAYLRSLPSVEKANQPIKLGPLAKILFATGKVPSYIPAASGLIRREHGFTEKPEEAATPEYGAYLIKAGCAGCHGQELKGGPIPGAPPEWLPAANIAADSTAAKWTKEQFVTAMREGKRPDGSVISPPMPIPLTSQLKDVELEAMWAYIHSQK